MFQEKQHKYNVNVQRNSKNIHQQGSVFFFKHLSFYYTIQRVEVPYQSVNKGEEKETNKENFAEVNNNKARTAQNVTEEPSPIYWKLNIN